MNRKIALPRTAGIGLMLLAAFAAGIFVAGLWRAGERPDGPGSIERESAQGRDMYSPSVSSDPSFRAQQRKNVEALETHCATTGEMCAEARAARIAFENLGRSR